MRRALPYAVAAAAAVVPRVAVIAYEGRSILDQAEKSTIFASTLVHHGTFGLVPGQPSAYTQPLYAWFLVPIYWLFGRNWLAVGLLQTAVAAATACLVYVLARRFLSERWAIVAAVVATVSPYIVWHDVHQNREILDQLLAVALVLATLRLAERITLARAAVLGVLAGIAILGNTRLFALPVVLVAFVLWRRGLVRPALAAAAVALAAAGLTLTPWLVRNRVDVGCFALTTDGRALWKANNANTHATLARGLWIDDVPPVRNPPPYARLNPEEAYTLWHRNGIVRHVDECAQMTYYENLVFAFWVDQPGKKAQLLPQAARMLWSPRVTETAASNRAASPIRRWVAPAYTIAIYALALVGVWFVPRAFALLVVLLLAYNTVAALAFAGATRYRIAWDFLLVVLAAAGGAWLVERVRMRSRQT